MDGTHRRWAVVLLALLTVAAGCSGGAPAGQDAGLSERDGAFAAGGGGGDGGGGDGAARTAAPEATPAAANVEGDEYSAAQFVERQRILTGQVAIEVEDFESARANLTEVTESYGGFVSDARVEVNRVDNETWTRGVVVLRVPRDNFTPLFERVKEEGQLLREDQNSRDVTDQLVDLQARLENLRAERDQLRVLYQRANDTETVLKVQERLSDVQGEIERLEARQQSLQRQVALSTITVELAEPRPDRPLPDQWYDVGLLSAFLESVDGVVVTLRAVSVAVAYALPYLVVFGIPLAAAGYVARERRGPRPPGRLRRRLSRGRDDEDRSDDGGDGGGGDEPSGDDGADER